MGGTETSVRIGASVEGCRCKADVQMRGGRQAQVIRGEYGVGLVSPQGPSLRYSVYAVDEAVDGHRDAASGRVPLRKAADAISTSIRAAVDRRRQSGVNPVLASESYEENNEEFEESEDMEDDGAVLPPR